MAGVGGARAPGATYLGDGRCRFEVWAPRAERIEVRFEESAERIEPLEPGDAGYHAAVLEGVPPGSRYLYRLDGRTERPDPASRYQPRGVHGPSAVVAPAFEWTDPAWAGLALEDYIFYELHVGTFTPEGTFDAVRARLDDLQALGVTALELMPVAQFPGGRNWGYDGVFPYAVQDTYGGPDGLKRLVDACHRRGLAVVLDVVYNHIGPEGNHLPDFAPYFTNRYHTPWGAALNFDDAGSDEVRRFFLENALYWVSELHVDALRLDAVHAILDRSAWHFTEELARAVRERAEALGRRVHLIAESDLNDPRLVRPHAAGGYGLDAQWSDDFHHALHALVTGERSGYYEDFGRLEHLATAYRDTFVFAGQHSTFRGRRHGRPADDVPARRFVVASQNHDQVGNRMKGERLAALIPFEAQKLTAAAVLLSPYLPLLFMGEEYGETAPFPYFVSHADAGLIEAVRRGRREEFAAFRWAGGPPDPQARATFESAILRHELRGEERHRLLLEFYRELIRLRKTLPALRGGREELEVAALEAPARVLVVRRWSAGDEVVCIFHFAGHSAAAAELPVPAGRWVRVLDSGDPRWAGDAEAVTAAVESDGPVRLDLGAWHAVVLRREQ